MISEAIRRGGAYKDIVDAIGNTPLVELPNLSPKPEVRLFAKLEGHNPTGSVKDRIAKYMIERAEATGELRPGQTILEPTSGNTGIGLAMIGRRKGYQVKVVMPENVSEERVQLLKLFGAEIIYSDPVRGTNGSIEVAKRIAEAEPDVYMPYQYGNEANPLAHYETTAPEIIRDLPEVDVFVAGLGTGGTLMGNGRRLREHNPNVKIIAAEPHPGDLVQGLRSMDEGFIPPIFNRDELDRIILVRSKDAFRATRELAREEGVFAGISSGAALIAALRAGQSMTRGNIVILFADGGWKYLSTGLWTKEDDDLSDEELDKTVWW